MSTFRCTALASLYLLSFTGMILIPVALSVSDDQVCLVLLITAVTLIAVSGRLVFTASPSSGAHR